MQELESRLKDVTTSKVHLEDQVEKLSAEHRTLMSEYEDVKSVNGKLTAENDGLQVGDADERACLHLSTNMYL